MTLPNWKTSTPGSIAFATAVLWIIAVPLSAQVPTERAVTMPDSSQIMTMMANSMRAMKPAQFVLDHKAELALAPEQVSFLEFLVVAHRDSTIARQARLITLTQVTMAKRPSGGPLGASSWEGKVDEGMIREGACEQSVVQAEMMINLVRDRHAVGGVLTPAQLARLPMVEANDMMKAVKKP